jgi:hypothetical protein
MGFLPFFAVLPRFCDAVQNPGCHFDSISPFRVLRGFIREPAGLGARRHTAAATMTSPLRAEPRIPYPWDNFFVGRELAQRQGGRTRRGVAKHFDSCTLGHHHPASMERLGVSMEIDFVVAWEDGTTEVLPDSSVAQLATQRFVEEAWVELPLLYLQRVSASPARLGGAGPRACLPALHIPPAPCVPARPANRR